MSVQVCHTRNNFAPVWCCFSFFLIVQHAGQSMPQDFPGLVMAQLSPIPISGRISDQSSHLPVCSVCLLRAGSKSFSAIYLIKLFTHVSVILVYLVSFVCYFLESSRDFLLYRWTGGSVLLPFTLLGCSVSVATPSPELPWDGPFSGCPWRIKLLTTTVGCPAFTCGSRVSPIPCLFDRLFNFELF